MAGSPDVTFSYRIYPSTAIFSAVYSDSYGNNNISFTNEDCTNVNNGYLEYTLTADKMGTLVVTAYNTTYTIVGYDGGSSYYELQLPTQNLYAWSYNSSATFWTDTETPTTASHIYDSYGNDVTSTYVSGERMIVSANTSNIRYATDTFSKIPINVSQSTIK